MLPWSDGPRLSKTGCPAGAFPPQGSAPWLRTGNAGRPMAERLGKNGRFMAGRPGKNGRFMAGRPGKTGRPET